LTCERRSTCSTPPDALPTLRLTPRLGRYNSRLQELDKQT